MKTLRTKVILSAFVLLFALVATIGSTYAWFTVSSTVTVETMNIDVQAQDSLLIRIYDGENQATADGWMSDVSANFSGFVTSTDISNATTAGYDALSTWKLRPLTAASAPTTADMTDYTALDLSGLSYITNIENEANRALTDGFATLGNSTVGGYVELKFWVVSQATANNVVMQDLTIAAAAGDTTAIADAVHVGTIEDDTPANENIFAKDSDYGFAFTADFAGFNETTGALNTVVTPATLTALHASFYDSSGTSTYSDADTTIGNATVIAALGADSPELVSVIIYIEGWDAEASNSIINASFDISFLFAIQ
ncbi:hypothetical protein RJI07_07415 [Mycoplasmatota bacterium WC30]